MTDPQIPPPGLKGKILVIDDELDIREGLYDLLTIEGGYAVELAHNGTEGLHKLDGTAYDLVLLDLMMPDMSGMDVLQKVRKSDTETPIFMITAYGSVEAAVDALKLGANDYFSKPWDNEKLIIEIDRMIARRLLEYENTHLKRALKQRYSFPNIIGKSERMVRLLDLVGQVASSRSTILITGETGTGKELVAKAIHANSPRADQMFVAVNSGSLPPELLESTLFGPREGRFHERDPDEKGILRGGGPRHDFLRRNRDPGAGDADQAAARESRRKNSRRWAPPIRSGWTYAFWRRPTRTLPNWSRKANSARICITG
jgi:DNA-binding NtrC family response regulator